MTKVTNKEMAVINCIANGRTIKAMAYELDATESMVERCRHRLMKKLGVVNAPQLIHYAYQNGILSLEPSLSK